MEVTGTVSEYSGLTEITVADGGETVLTDAAIARLPPGRVARDNAEREALEGMLIEPQGEFTVTDNYSTNQFGEMGLAAGTPRR